MKTTEKIKEFNQMMVGKEIEELNAILGESIHRLNNMYAINFKEYKEKIIEVYNMGIDLIKKYK